MENQPINKDVSEEDLNLIYDSIDDLNKELNNVAVEIFKNETDKKVLSKPSHFTFSIVHRAIELNRGFKALTETNNWITAINLIRLQADNCMRLFALSLVPDRLDFYQRIMKGEHIRNIEDGDGNKMTDYYLSKKLDILYPGFRLLYGNTSGFIHFSKEHMNINNDRIDNGDDFVMYIRLAETTEFPIHKKIDYAFNMFMTGKELYKLLKCYKLSKEDFMKNYGE
ncbi:hypothetical protein [Psychroflexus sp. MES1-P1E]|jgi:hypothetical protein|uniref:hypothetical protein n=1 Tax=Psychroflexus sp. MES1-P1E TaxID=2058320 RepID=UPI000C7D0BAF|nr:hypothetical protein [Psychroflexus sp. MES1-P1E]PKG42865.1 hypothetical protein CXF67_08035 [Psychroflexus sp. MES1-P1E]